MDKTHEELKTLGKRTVKIIAGNKDPKKGDLTPDLLEITQKIVDPESGVAKPDVIIGPYDKQRVQLMKDNQAAVVAVEQNKLDDLDEKLAEFPPDPPA